MNTKQKLTLGIAAIFMVTLTIVGVTYAYFVTRVNYTGTQTTAVVQTATIGSSFHADDDTVVIDNAIPGAMGWKTFYVDSGSTQNVPFALKISSSLNVQPDLLAANPDKTDWVVAEHASPAFIHSLKDDGVTPYTSGFVVDDVCYKESVVDKTGCYTGSRYDNIEVTIYRIMPEDYILDPKEEGTADDVLGDGDDFKAETVTKEEVIADTDNTQYTLTFTSGRTAKATVITAGEGYAKGIKVPYNESFSTATGAIFVGDMQQIAAKAQESDPDNYNLYVLKVEYINRNKNQNIENEASVSIKVDIDGTASITQ